MNHTYKFIRQYRDSVEILPKAVREEIFYLRSLLPLFFVDVRVGWSDDLYASDASPFALGVCHRHVSGEVLREAGQHSERWRYLIEGGCRARDRALARPDNHDHDPAIPSSTLPPIATTYCLPSAISNSSVIGDIPIDPTLVATKLRSKRFEEVPSEIVS